MAAALLALALERGGDRPSSGGRTLEEKVTQGEEASAGLMLALLGIWIMLFGRVRFYFIGG